MTWRDKASVGLLRTLSVDGHRVREYADRLAVHSLPGEDSISWETLQKIKTIVWGTDAYAVEVFPADGDVVNLRPTRHLWRCDWRPPQHPEFARAGVTRRAVRAADLARTRVKSGRA
jgi:hypothetical protein